MNNPIFFIFNYYSAASQRKVLLGRATVLGKTPNNVALPRKISTRRKAHQGAKAKIDYHLVYAVLTSPQLSLTLSLSSFEASKCKSPHLDSEYSSEIDHRYFVCDFEEVYR